MVVMTVPIRSMLLRSSRTIHGSTGQNAIISVSTATSRSFYASTSEQQSQALLNPSHVQLHPGITFATLQQQNHMWMTPVRTMQHNYYLVSPTRNVFVNK
jgi:hypothetical protein